MKKFIALICSAFLLGQIFAFEGIIEQTFVDPSTKASSTFKWFIKGDQIRLEIGSGDEVMYIIPDFQTSSLILFGNQADENGDYWYSKTPIHEIQANVPQLRLLEKATTTYEGEEAEELKVMTGNGLAIVQYLPSIQVDMKNMLTFFAESVEFQAIGTAAGNGFPVNSILMTQADAVYTLTTKSITPQTIDVNLFNPPTNYKLFTGIK